MDHFCYLCFMFVFFMLFCLFLQPCDHLLGKGGPLGCLVCCVFLCFCYLPYGVLSQVWYLIVPIPDLYLPLYYFVMSTFVCLFLQRNVYYDRELFPAVWHR